MREIRIGTRGSVLAVAQAQIVADEILRSHPDARIELVKITTTGDRNMKPFSSDPLGIKGMFTLELEEALRSHEIDFAVHSLKDLPANISPDLPIVAYSKRGNPRDSLVCGENVNVIGSSSMRRRLQLERIFPESKIIPVRGNITTRLKRLDDGEYSALVLAVSGLQRLGLAHRITRIFTVDEVLPAPGQGILACQGRAGEDYGYLSCVDDSESRCCALAERSFSRSLGGGCNVPVGAYGVVEGESLTLRGLYVEESSRKFFSDEVTGLRSEAESLGNRLATIIKYFTIAG